jgi:hypothetical protein
MSYLLYCITNLTDKSHPQTIAGVSGESVQLVVEKKLCIAISKVNHAVLKHSLADVLSFRRVIDSFHAKETIIPMRYGGIVEDAAHARRVLEKGYSQYEAVLSKLEGMVEMGVRLLLESDSCDIHDSHSDQKHVRSEQQPVNPEPLSQGAAYLAARRIYYLEKDRAASKNAPIVARISGRLNGIFVCVRHEEIAWNGQNTLSIYYLLQRNSVDAFRHALQEIMTNESAELLISGPWPPFNFVLPGDFEPRLATILRH